MDQLALVLSTLQMLIQRVEALEARRGAGVRGVGQLREAVCDACQQPFVRRSSRNRTCDRCKRAYKADWNKARWAARKARGDTARRRVAA